MTTAIVIPGWIKANGGDTQRIASSIAYTIAWEFPGGPFDWPNCKPHGQRPPDIVDGEPLETIPLPVGSWVHGTLIDGTTIWWHEKETVAMARCTTGGPPGMTSEQSKRRLESLGLPSPGSGASSGGAAGEGGGVGGGGLGGGLPGGLG